MLILFVRTCTGTVRLVLVRTAATLYFLQFGDDIPPQMLRGLSKLQAVVASGRLLQYLDFKIPQYKYIARL